MRTDLGNTAPMRAPNSTVGHRATAEADRRRAAGGNVAALERRFDGPVPAEQRAAAEQQDAAAAAIRAADPLVKLQHDLREAERNRNVDLLALQDLTPFLLEHAGKPDDVAPPRRHEAGCCYARLGTLREEAKELRERIIAAVVQITALNLALGRLLKAAA